MWIGPDSLTGFLELFPRGISILFVSYGGAAWQRAGRPGCWALNRPGDGARSRPACVSLPALCSLRRPAAEATAAEDAAFMRDQLVRAAKALTLPPGRVATLMARVHFATVPASRVPGWLPGLLADWPREQRVAQLVVPPVAGLGPTRSFTVGRIDSWYGWLPTGSLATSTPLALAGTDCSWVPDSRAAANSALAGKVAVVTLTRLPSTLYGAPCSYLRLMRGAVDAGAAALLMVAPPGGFAAPANCTGGGPRSPLNRWGARRGARPRLYSRLPAWHLHLPA